MIYLDYSATTPVNNEVLDVFCKVSKEYIGNPNSTHSLGLESKKLMDAATDNIANILKVKSTEIIYTSCATEANNLVLKGIAFNYKNRGNHIITSPLEHSSIYGPLSYLQDNGYKVDFVSLNEDGTIDLDHLRQLITDETILVSVGAVNSETGIRQNINEIADIVHESNNCLFHSDITQLIGKETFSLLNIDLATFSAHKFYGLKGIGVLFKKEHLKVTPLIHGGKSTTIYRSGTPALGLIVSTAKALKLANKNLDSKSKHVAMLNGYLRKELESISGVLINSNERAINHVLNLSVPGIKPETFMRMLDKEEIYISSQTACSSGAKISKSVYAITKDEAAASSSLRISLSSLTTMNELKEFVRVFKNSLKKLKMK